MDHTSVTPAEAGVPLSLRGSSGVSAFAGMTAVLLLLLLLLATPAFAQTFPKLTGRVVDQAELLTPEQELEISSKSEALEKQTGRQLVIATVKSLEGRTIEDYGYRLGRTWAIGEQGKDNGVILLVAPTERKVRIETGYGARVFMTDALSSVIVREAILPRFKAGDYGGGIGAGTDAIIKVMSMSPQEAQQQAAEASKAEAARRNAGSAILPAFFWVLILTFVLLSMLRRGSGRRYRRRRGGIDPWVVLWGLNALNNSGRSGWGSGSGWSGGSSGWSGGGGFGSGGGFSGGGGSFGGGGASGGW